MISGRTESELVDQNEIEVKELMEILYPKCSDNPIPVTGYSVMSSDGSWMPAERSIWESWTGLRAVWNNEYHGSVKLFGGSEGTPPYTGSRVCRCKICQEHVASNHKPN